MKYAVPVIGGELCPHFGHCEEFVLIDVDEAGKKIIGRENVPAPAHQPGLLPPWLAERGVNLVIAGGMGMRAQQIFQQNGIDVVFGTAEPDPEKAVLAHLNGRLSTGDNICDH